MKKFLLSIILAAFLIVSPASAEFFSDIIVTSPNGIWTDSRAYTTLNDAISAVGANERTIRIVSPQVVTTLTIPSTVTLEFIRDGSITNSGQLTLNTKNIIAPNRQIFTGVGNIDFAAGSVVKTGWFSNIETAFALTGNDEITLIVSKPQTITASYSPGNDVHLKWENPGNILTVNAAVVVGNLKNIEAGNYQLFAGAGDFDFLDGTELKLNWFNQLSSVLTWVENEEVTIIVNEDSVVQASDASAANENIKVVPGGVLNLDAGVVLTINGPFDAGLYQVFSGAGTVAWGLGVEVWADWWGKDGTALQAAYDSVPRGSTIKMSGGDWAFGAVEVDLFGVDKQVTVQGTGFNEVNVGGTNITATGNYAIKIAGQTILEKVRISCSGTYGLVVGNSGGSPVSWVGRAQDVYVTGASTAGIYCQGAQLAYMENVWSQSNTGAGMTLGTVDNTSLSLVKCQFRSNTLEGVVLDGTNSKFKFVNCFFESNGKEGVKNSAVALQNTVFEYCWWEDNWTSASSGYQVNLANNTNINVVIRNSFLNSPATPWDGATGTKHIFTAGELILENNQYTGAAQPIIGDVNDGGVIDIIDSISVQNIGFIGGAYTANVIFRGAPIVEAYTVSTSLEQYVNLIATNSGAGGAITFTLPPCKAGLKITFSVAALQQLSITPRAGDQIVPLTMVAAQGIYNIGLIGDTITLVGLDSTHWVVEEQVGIWSGASSNVIRALADNATPSVRGWDKWKTGGVTTITDFDDGIVGQIIYVISEHAIIITDGTNIFLSGSANFTMAASDTLTLIMKGDNKWYELSRSVN